MNVEQLLDEQNIKYRSQGRDCVIRCIHPEHEDVHPSLRIDRVSGVFHCLSCGHKGNIFTHFGKDVSVVDVEVAKVKNKISSIQGNINLTMPENAIPFKHNYRGIDLELLLKYEAFTVDDIDALKDRIVFPIRNLYGEIKAFCARRIHSDADPKYVFYPKHVTIPLFPADPKEVINGSIILVEGIFDALNLIQKGLPNAVSIFGTNTFAKRYSVQKLEYYKVLGITKIYIMLDSDEAGIKAAYKAEAMIKPLFAVEVIELPENRDPGDLTYEEVSYIRDSIYESGTS